jgi:hypothetical protein
VWWDRSEPLEVYLSDVAAGRGATATAPAHWVDTSGLDDSLKHAAAWLDPAVAPGARRVRVWLCASLARPYLVPAASGARNKREARALATAMAADASGIDGGVRIWLDRWRSGASTLAVGIPVDVWRGLHDIVEARNSLRTKMPRQQRSPATRIVSVRPWWNLPFDALLAESRGEASRIGWSLTGNDGVLHCVVDRGSVVEIGFDRPGPNDPTGRLLRRRLQMNWGVTAAMRHLVFERHASSAEPQALPIGAWRDVSGNGV